MAKILKCNHCGKEVKHWVAYAHEVDYYKLNDKWYCGDCLQKFSIYYVKEAHL